MHEESSYEGLDPIECEVRRRTFWVLFGGLWSISSDLGPNVYFDTIASLQLINRCPFCLGGPLLYAMKTVLFIFPKNLTMNGKLLEGHLLEIKPLIHLLTFSITPTAYLLQPPGKTALISGLNYISRIFALLGEILVRIRVDKRSPPTGHFATARLEETQSLHNRIMAAMIHAPEPLRLKKTQPHSNIPLDDGGAGFRQATFAVVKDMFDNPYASRENALNPYLVLQANLFVTQASCLTIFMEC